MTSVAVLAGTVRIEYETLNFGFYDTAATVIPVLFLALAVQGRGYEELLKASDWVWEGIGQIRGPRKRLKKTAAYIAGAVPTLTALGILIFGVIGEIFALASIYKGYAVGDPLIVALAPIFLTIAAATVPVTTFVRPLFAGVAGARGRRPDDASSPGDRASSHGSGDATVTRPRRATRERANDN